MNIVHQVDLYSLSHLCFFAKDLRVNLNELVDNGVPISTCITVYIFAAVCQSQQMKGQVLAQEANVSNWKPMCIIPLGGRVTQSKLMGNV